MDIGDGRSILLRRVGDAEREEVVARLHDHHVSGRLTTLEFEERVERALSARTAVELAELTCDLPESVPGHRPAIRIPDIPGHF